MFSKISTQLNLYTAIQEPQEKLELSLDTGKIEQTVIVFPFRTLWLEDYNRWQDFTKELALELKANFENPDVIKPRIDKMHKYDENHGKILELFIDENGKFGAGLYAKVRFNTIGFELVKSERYTGLSPSIKPYVSVTKKEYNNVLWALSLVTYQGLGTSTPDLTNQLELKKQIPQQKEKAQMPMPKLALELGLNPEASEESILENFRSVKLELKTKTKEALELKTLTDEQKKTIDEIQKKFNDMCDQMKAAEEASVDQAMTSEIEASIQNNKTDPSFLELIKNPENIELKKAYKEMFKKDKEKFKLAIELSKGVNTQQKTLSNSKGAGIELSVKLKELMIKNKINPDNKNEVELFLANYKEKGEK